MQEDSQLDVSLNQMTQIIHLAEGQSIFGYAITVFIVFMIGKFISSFAKGFFTRTLATLFGLSLISDSFRIAGFTVTAGLILGIGFVVPHIMYYLNYLLVTFFKVQSFTINTYYILITIWYKIRRFFNWIGTLFTKKSASSFKENENSNYQSKDSSFGSNEEAYQEYTKKHYHKEQKQQSQSKQQKKQSSSSYSSSESTKDYSSGNSLEDKLRKDPKYAQFFSSSYYEVLGVDSSMSFKEIKKAYRKLVGMYHPDLNPDNEEVCTLITQRLNRAYEYFQRQQS